MAISDWPAAERPREKLLAKGASALSDAELLAIFLRTGCAGKSAVDLARELLSEFGSLRHLLQAPRTQFCSAHGLGDAKYAQLQAVLEMAKRHLEETLSREQALTNPKSVKDYLTAQLRHLDHEVFAVLYLDTQHRLLAFENLFNGTIDGAAVYSREVVRKCLNQNAAAVIFAHNHPSGIAEPSRADRDITQRLVDALGLVDVRVLDHMVVGEGEIVSFAERGWL
ncbi:RadC family protein [Sessilibacter sp. MAH2]